jgi:acetyl-CoA C-acetyltransferase
VVERVGIIGVGYEGFRPTVADLSTREMMYEAAAKAYADAGIDPRDEVGSFICCTEDLWEGWSIADEMVPDQVGGARRPVCTVPADGIVGLGHGIMQIGAGVADVVAVEAHSKVADVLDRVAVENLGLDPVYQRTVGVNSDVLAGLEMSGFMKSSGVDREELSTLVSREKEAAMLNERASYGTRLSVEDVSQAEPVALPLRRYDRSEYAEAGIVLVLASGKWIDRHGKEAVYVEGLTWRSSTPWHEGGDLVSPRYAKDCLAAVAKQAGVKSMDSFDVMELDDTYAFKLLQHLMASGESKASAVKMLDGIGRRLNPSGGSLGAGHLIEATGSHKVLECVLQLRGQAGRNQQKGVERAIALSWRGNPSGTGAAVALSGSR